MTPQALAAAALRLLVVVVLLASGAYLLIYLYRWEWNRAIVSGIFFLSAEIALVAAVLLRRLRSLEERSIDGPTATMPTVERRIAEARVERPNPFGWLRPQDRLGVFVPVLLGAGVVLSAVAYVVERFAEAVAMPSVDRRLSSRLAKLQPPDGGLAGTSGPIWPATSAARLAPGRSWSGSVVGLLAIGLLVWLGILFLLDTTQSRPDDRDRPLRTSIELAISHRGVPADVAETAEALWVDCRSAVGRQSSVATVSASGDDRASLLLEPGIRALATRRLTGCLSDLRLNRVQATVLAVRHEPAARDDAR